MHCTTPLTALLTAQHNHWMTDRRTRATMSVNNFVRRPAGIRFFVAGCLAITILTLHVILSPKDYVDIRSGNFIPDPKLVERLCSFEVIQNYIKESKRFPSEGMWINTDPRTAEYQLSLCKFEYQKTLSLPKTYFEECAEKKCLRNILVVGDSNAGRQQIGVVDLLQASNFSCKLLKTEHRPNNARYMPDANYYLNGSGIAKEHLEVHLDDCSSCTSRKTKCSKKITSGRQLDVEVEYLSMEFLNDIEITTFRNRFNKQCPPRQFPCYVSSTHQQFIFREYLRKGSNYPDLIFLHGNNHDIRRRPLPQIRVDMQTMISLIREYVPQTTKVVWFTTPGENIQKKPTLFLKEVFRLPSGNLTPEAMIVRLNKELFKVLEPELSRPNTSILPFFDIEVIGRPIRTAWNLDGMHMRREWYPLIASYVMQTLCNSNFTLK